MIRRPPRSTQSRSSAASDVYKRQGIGGMVQHVAALTDLARVGEDAVQRAFRGEVRPLVEQGRHHRAGTGVDEALGVEELEDRRPLGLGEGPDRARSRRRGTEARTTPSAVVGRPGHGQGDPPVSYTHLTLPTIYSV